MSALEKAPAALELLNVSKRFGSAPALESASLSVRAGTVHAVLGENGAGKTTLMRIAFGMLQPDAGRTLVSGAPTSFRSPADAIAAGIGMVHQHFTNVPAMTVAENVALGGHGRFDLKRARADVPRVSASAGLPLDPDALAGELPVGAQQRLEIVKALARGARTLLLDEPTAVLAPDEVDQLLHWLRAFASGGGSAVLITHKLHEALAAADDVTVLRRGMTVFTGTPATATTDTLAAAMLGEAAAPRSSATGERSMQPGPVVVVATNLTLHDPRGLVAIRDASFALHANEIVGIAAVEGSGQRELLLALAGRLAPATGTLKLPARTGFVPEDRHRDAMILDFTLAENVALHGAGSRKGRLDWRSVGQSARELVQSFDVRGARGPRPELTKGRALSGGNQQKLVLGRELNGAPSLLVAENPTRGLDIRATEAVHERLRAARNNGACVVVYSSDLDEVLGLSDRVLVVHAGAVRETTGQRDEVGRAMLGVTSATLAPGSSG